MHDFKSRKGGMKSAFFYDERSRRDEVRMKVQNISGLSQKIDIY